MQEMAASATVPVVVRRKLLEENEVGMFPFSFLLPSAASSSATLCPPPETCLRVDQENCGLERQPQKGGAYAEHLKIMHDSIALQAIKSNETATKRTAGASEPVVNVQRAVVAAQGSTNEVHVN